MHASVRILKVRRVNGGEWFIEVLAKFVEHKSRNYASTGRPEYGPRGLEAFAIVSTSFYDKRLCVWKLQAGIYRE